MKAWYDVTDFNAVGDGNTPAEGAIAAAITAASKTTGGVVWFPPGRYLLGKKLIVDQQVTLLGAGWSSKNTMQGSWIGSRVPDANLELRGEGTTVEALGFYQEQLAPLSADWQPGAYDFAIRAGADDISLKQINLFNCTNGISITHYTGGAIGRVVLDRIWGRPLRTGIWIDNALDVVKVNNVHFWPFWEVDNAVVSRWVLGNGTAISVGRADNPQFSNIFTLGYQRGFAFSGTPNGVTSRFAIVNGDCDACECGLEIGGVNATGAIKNFNATGESGGGNVGISVVSPGVRLFASNLRVTQFRANAVRVSGDNVRVFIQNLWTELWNLSGKGFPAVEATENATVYLGYPLFFDRGNGAANYAGTTGGQVLAGSETKLFAQQYPRSSRVSFSNCSMTLYRSRCWQFRLLRP